MRRQDPGSGRVHGLLEHMASLIHEPTRLAIWIDVTGRGGTSVQLGASTSIGYHNLSAETPGMTLVHICVRELRQHARVLASFGA
jgi:hypothetical protein